MASETGVKAVEVRRGARAAVRMSHVPSASVVNKVRVNNWKYPAGMPVATGGVAAGRAVPVQLPVVGQRFLTVWSANGKKYHFAVGGVTGADQRSIIKQLSMDFEALAARVEKGGAIVAAALAAVVGMGSGDWVEITGLGPAMAKMLNI